MGRTYNQEYLLSKTTYLARLSFRFDGQIKSFSDKQKLTEFSTTKPALQQMLKNFSRQKTREGKVLPTENKPRTIKKMVIRSYIPIITLNVNGLNAPIKRHRLAEQMKTRSCTHFHFPHHSAWHPPQIVCNYFFLLLG